MTVAVRTAPVGFRSIDRTVVPLPLPELPDMMWIQLADSEAVQLHPAVVVTPIFAVCPATMAFTVVELTV